MNGCPAVILPELCIIIALAISIGAELTRVQNHNQNRFIARVSHVLWFLSNKALYWY